MKKTLKFLSAIMAFCMLLGTFSVLSAISVSAEGATVEEPKQEPTNAIDFLTTVFASKEEKIATMDFKLERNGYQLYVEPLTGEVAIKNAVTGDILTTNPYDVGSIKATDAVKDRLLSQIIINYSSVDGIETGGDLLSFSEAAENNQIKIKNIKNGIRVEYIMGKQETRYLAPEVIDAERFEALMKTFPYDPETGTEYEPGARSAYKKIRDFYTLKDPTQAVSDTILAQMYKEFPVLKKGTVLALYVLDTAATVKEKNELEGYFLRYLDYSFEQRELDHEICDYEAEDANPVQFRVALEYYLDEDGLRVRLPANGIRYDQSTYILNKIACLPYMGAGRSANTGYTVFPDGSGTLTRFEDVAKDSTSFSFFATPYGQDYAYHSLKMGKNLMPMRMPVFGLVNDVPTGSVDLVTGEPITRTEGYFAIIEEGDTLAMVRATHGDRSHPYNYIQTELDPRPKDTYELNVVSKDGDTTFTKVSNRKYTGSFVIRYIMLTDIEYAAENGIDASKYYDTSYVGMALAYRARLIKTGELTDRIDDTQKDAPLYLEALGALDTKDKVLSIPVTVKKALTTFEDVKTIQKELGENGVNNLVFKLTGFINGGLKSTLANKIKAEKVVGGNSGLKKLQKYANEKGFEIYLDTDFSYAKKDTSFDGFNRKTTAVRTVDDRFVKKQTYSAVLQKFTSTNQLVISPSSFENIFGKLEGDAKKLGLKGLALAGLGSDISSDFDEDEPYNREDSKGHIVDTLKKVRKMGYNILMDGGNAFAVGYATHVLNIPLDSSRRSQASEAIPFFGLVYHGYVNYAGSPTNMAGDIRYETLKMLENGANPYFVLVYRNAEKLKEDSTLSSYFSISYENWRKDIISSYKQINSALGPVVNSPFANHEFLTAMRVPTAEEIEADEKAKAENEAEYKKLLEEYNAEMARYEALKSHLTEVGGDISGLIEPTAPVYQAVDTDKQYILDNGFIVKVTFENGYSFILNYNIYDITVEETGDTVIKSLGFVVLDKEGKIVVNSGEEEAA